MKCLVTGATGFLGSHLIRDLKESGFEIRALVRKSSDQLDVSTIVGDLTDYSSLLEALKDIDVVFHVAGAMSAHPKDKNRLFTINVDGVKNLLDASVEMKIKKLIHVSSVVAVGVNLTAEAPLLNEESLNITRGREYANYDSKREGEELVLKYAREGKLAAVVVNPGLIYGAGDVKKEMRKGNVLAAKGKLGVYPTGGVNVVAVEDVTKAMIRAVNKGHSGERYLLTGDNITIKELLTTISEFAGAKPPQKPMPMKLLMFLARGLEAVGIKTQLCKENIFSAGAYHWYDHSKAQRDLDFHPKSYKEAIKNSVEWMKSNHFL